MPHHRHSVSRSYTEYPRETRTKFACTQSGCPGFVCHVRKFRRLLRFVGSHLKGREDGSAWNGRLRGKLDLADSSISVLDFENSVFDAAVSLARTTVARGVEGEFTDLRGPFNARSLQAVATDLPHWTFRSLVTLTGAQIDSAGTRSAAAASWTTTAIDLPTNRVRASNVGGPPWTFTTPRTTTNRTRRRRNGQNIIRTNRPTPGS